MGDKNGVRHVILDQNGQVIQQSGLTPRELVTITDDAGHVISRSTQFEPFATPRTTINGTAFTDTPIGTCFQPPPQNNICFNIVQLFDVLVPTSTGSTVKFDISTITIRRDCVRGIRITVQGSFGGNVFSMGVVN